MHTHILYKQNSLKIKLKDAEREREREFHQICTIKMYISRITAF